MNDKREDERGPAVVVAHTEVGAAVGIVIHRTGTPVVAKSIATAERGRLVVEGCPTAAVVVRATATEAAGMQVVWVEEEALEDKVKMVVVETADNHTVQVLAAESRVHSQAQLDRVVHLQLQPGARICS